jgi:hypothetical protein
MGIVAYCHCRYRPSICLFVRMYQCGSHWTVFYEICCRWLLWKICRRNSKFGLSVAKISGTSHNKPSRFSCCQMHESPYKLSLWVKWFQVFSVADINVTRTRHNVMLYVHYLSYYSWITSLFSSYVFYVLYPLREKFRCKKIKLHKYQVGLVDELKRSWAMWFNQWNKVACCDKVSLISKGPSSTQEEHAFIYCLKLTANWVGRS